MKLVELVGPRAIVPNLSSADRNGAIRELVQVLADAERMPADQVEPVVKSIIARERTKGTTGFGKGVAAPHAKVAGLTQVIAAVGRSVTGVDFSSLDGGPVYGVVLLVSPADKPEEHLRAMELVFRVLQKEKFRKFLRQCETAEAIYELLTEAEELSISG